MQSLDRFYYIRACSKVLTLGYFYFDWLGQSIALRNISIVIFTIWLGKLGKLKICSKNYTKNSKICYLLQKKVPITNIRIIAKNSNFHNY